MKQITRVNHIGIRVYNLAIARQFYEKLGFEFIVGPVGPEPVAIMEHPSGININLILNSAQKSTENVLMDIATKHSGYTHVALEVNDLTTIIQQLADFDIGLTEGPLHFPTGDSIFIRDPDKNVIEFHQPK